VAPEGGGKERVESATGEIDVFRTSKEGEKGNASSSTRKKRKKGAALGQGAEKKKDGEER